MVAVAAAASAAAARAQEPLTLQQAIERAMAGNHEARIAALAQDEAVHRVTQARSGYLPRVEVSEGWQRGNQPVFVFGALLSQRRFRESDFAIAALNRPDAVDDVRLSATAEQTIFDGGATRARVRAAHVGVQLAESTRVSVGQALALAATEAYGAALHAEASRATAASAVEAARADLARVRARRDAGLVTDADVLAVEVHHASVEEARLRASLAADLARAELNRVMGEPLDSRFTLPRLVAMPPETEPSLERLEAVAVARRTDLQQARLLVDLAAAHVSEARARFLPEVFAHVSWEGHGSGWDRRAGSWVAGAGLRLNVFRGFADRARLAEASDAARRRAVERDQAETAIRLDVRAAAMRLSSARAREAVAANVVQLATERQRIVRDRYEQGLADAVALLTAAEALVQAQEQQVRARVDVLVGSARLERAIGR